MIEIDGSTGEGGGQILRTSLTLAALTGQSLRLRNLRANREQPGLRPQHLTAVKAIGKITRAELQGATQGSTELTLHPQALRPGKYQFDIGTAGALTLVLQTIALPLSFAEGTSWVTLTGGTHVRWSPTYHTLQEGWLPVLKSLGFRIEMVLEKAGFFPGGGGKAKLKVLPHSGLTPYCCTERGELAAIRGYSGVANLSNEIAARQKHQALKRLYPVCRDTKIQTLHLPSPVKGTFILLKAHFKVCGWASFTALGAPGKPAEQVADEAVDRFLTFMETDGCVDPYLADQLLLPLALIEGRSAFRTSAVTGHLLTNAHVIRQFLPSKIEIEGQSGAPGLVEIQGSFS